MSKAINRCLKLVIVAILLFQMVALGSVSANENALKSSDFQQNNKYTGFLEGDYKRSAVYPTEENWTRQSRYPSIREPKILWEYIVDEYQAGNSYSSSRIFSVPIIDSDGTIYVSDQPMNASNQRYLYAVNKDGSLKWKSETGSSDSSVVIASDGMLYSRGIDTYTNKSYLFSIRNDGVVNWKADLGSSSAKGSPALDEEGFIYVGLHNGVGCFDTNGEKIWQYTTDNSFIDFGTPIISKDGSIYVTNYYNTETESYNTKGFTRLDKKTGKHIKSLLLDIGTYMEKNEASILNYGNVYIPSNYASVYTSDLNTVWKSGSYDYAFHCPAISDKGVMYFTTDWGYIYAVDVNGKVIWKTTTDCQIMNAPILTSDEYLYVNAYNGMYCFDSSGNQLWKYSWEMDKGGRYNFPSSFSVGSDGTIYLSADKYDEAKEHTVGVLYALGRNVPILNVSSADNKQVALSWTSPVDMDIAGYQLEYKKAGDASWYKVDIKKVSSYTVSSLVNDTEYSFRICAYDSLRKWTDYSTEVKGTPIDTAPISPANLKAAPMEKGMLLTWVANTEPDLAGYQIEYKASKATAWKSKAIEKAAEAYTVAGLLNGTEYEFRIKAKDIGGNWSPYSQVIKGTPVASTSNQTPQAGSKYYDLAEKLSLLNIFKGTGNGFELDRQPTRIEGLVMLIRLLGKESEAQALQGESCIFSDVPDWGKGYVNYAYKNKLTNGVGEGLFGSSNLMDAKSYITFMLRALQFNDSNGDFSWNEAMEMAKNIEMIDEITYEHLKHNAFLRDDVALISYNTLLQKLKESNNSLAQKLVNEGVIPEKVAEEMEILSTAE